MQYDGLITVFLKMAVSRFLLFWVLLCPLKTLSQATVSGIVRESTTGERIPYATVCLRKCSVGVTANSQGFYALQIPSDTIIEVRFSSAGFMPKTFALRVSVDSTLDVTLASSTTVLEEVTVTYSDTLSSFTENSHLQVDLAALRRIPSLLGEKDIMRMLQVMPGVQRASEASAALYVRGGGPEQNLILLDEAPVYNAFHLFGLFSVFNSDAVSRIDFWKGGFPARYGGRISSITEILVKDGNQEKVSVKGGIGLLSSRITIDGPLIKDRSTFMFSIRRSYLDLVLTPFLPKEGRWRYVLGDGNLKLTYKLGTKDKLVLSGYVGTDKFNISGGDKSIQTSSGLHWGNVTTTLRWSRIISPRLFLNTTALYSAYEFELQNKTETNILRNDVTTFSSTVNDYSVKGDLDFFLTNQHSMKGGMSLTNHIYKPRVYRVHDLTNGFRSDTIQQYTTQEIGMFIEDGWRLNERLRLLYGIRLSGLNAPNRFYLNPEPRLSLSYRLPHNIEFNGSYSRTNQFVHLLSNTGIGLATDLWVPVTDKVPPLRSDQLSGGLKKEWYNKGLRLTLETYRKQMMNIISYTEDANFLAISGDAETFHWEDNITIGRGKAYGTEILLEKTTGKFTGWMGYTLSWVVHQFDALNKGQAFFPRHDSRHNITTQFSYEFTERISFSLGWFYNSGNPFSAPHAFYPTTNVVFSNPMYITQFVPYFGSQNSFRGEAYHRLDAAVRLSRKGRRFERYWEIGVYNAYGRKNPFYYYLTYESDAISGKQVGVLKSRSLLTMIPSVTYHFQF